VTNGPDRRILATRALDTLDAAIEGLAHWLKTGERVDCPRCGRSIPAATPTTPARHKRDDQWCEDPNTDWERSLT